MKKTYHISLHQRFRFARFDRFARSKIALLAKRETKGDSRERSDIFREVRIDGENKELERKLAARVS